MDLAARNVLVLKGSKVKIADFGIAQTLAPGKEIWKMNKKMKLPIQWLAPEGMKSYTFSSKTDCWSYGMICFEVVSGGKIPFSSIPLKAIKAHVLSGGTPDVPVYCSSGVSSIMQSCWVLDPSKRASFKVVLKQLVKQILPHRYTKTIRDIGALASKSVSQRLSLCLSLCSCLCSCLCLCLCLCFCLCLSIQ